MDFRRIRGGGDEQTYRQWFYGTSRRGDQKVTRNARFAGDLAEDLWTNDRPSDRRPVHSRVAGQRRYFSSIIFLCCTNPVV
jgi:hypothetical protein